jgi:hypothetical protein
MSESLKEALWWTVVFIVIAVTIAAGVRIVDWLTEGTGSQENIWKVALVLVGGAGAGGKAITAIRQGIKRENGIEASRNGSAGDPLSGGRGTIGE